MNPVGFNPRRRYDPIMRSQEEEDIIYGLVAKLIGTDYLSRNDDIRFSGLRGLSNTQSDRRMEELLCDDMIRRHNLIVQVANSMVTPSMEYAEVHPKVSSNGADAGRYPRDFDRPRNVNWFFNLDLQTLERIIQDYGLIYAGRDFRDIFGNRYSNNIFNGMPGGLGIATDRNTKLTILFEFLGLNMQDEGRFVDPRRERERERLLGGPARVGYPHIP